MGIQGHHHIEQQLVNYLAQHADVYEAFDATTDLLDQGILDSLLVTDLVLFIRQQFGIELTARDISPEHMSSIERMARLIADKQEKLKRAA